MPPVSHSFTSLRQRLHYVEWGEPDAPVLLLVHGGRDHARSWDWTAEALAKDWRVIAPDLRGHGDSAWTSDGQYSMEAYVYDLAQLIDQIGVTPVTIVSHSMGGNIALRYTGAYPDRVRRLVAIEGLGPSPKTRAELDAKGMPARLKKWIEEAQKASGRTPRRYASIDDALTRMMEQNTHLTPDQARHLTIHGVNRNEDGTWSWKFDPYLNLWPPADTSAAAMDQLWGAITCPVLLMYGADSWASNPERDGRLAPFRDARVVEYANAGHWLHHDQFDRFIADVKAFL